MSTQSTPVQMFIESHSLVRERVFLARDAVHALAILKMEHATGKLVLNITSGTIGSIQFIESSKLTSGQ